MIRAKQARALALLGALAILMTACSTTGAPSGGGQVADVGKPFVFASTQFTPVIEQENMRKKILADYKGAAVDFITDQEAVILDRISAEAKAGGQGQIGVVGLENGQFSSLAAAGAFEDLSKLADKQKDKKIPQDMLTLGKFGGNTQVYVPWMQATYFLVANKKALQYLPSGADVNALTYKQLIDWAKNITDKTGQRRFGFPLGAGTTPGLIHRLVQGYFYPLKELWKYSNPQSTTYGVLQEPLQSEEIWLGIDHAARMIEVLKAKPDDFVAVPAPAGPKGRYYMSVVIGLAIPKTTPNRTGGEALIDHLLKPETQLITLRENSFFPVVDVKLPDDLNKGLKLEADAVAKQANAKDAKVVPLPVGLGAKGGEFNTAITNTFVRIVVKNEPIQTVLNEQGAIVQKAITDANAKCWGPDGTSSGPCQVK
ncbi:MAG: extracellular solute-binding protein [Chloroflexi bacterium]|nr:MAG: extracellular solute-binding protein [Chloroflexota bacterium]